jgi:hypothetical protein
MLYQLASFLLMKYNFVATLAGQQQRFLELGEISFSLSLLSNISEEYNAFSFLVSFGC